MIFEKYLKDKEAFIFELDDVLYPEKDYLLQVYYLFAQFIEYGEQINGQEIIDFMRQSYLQEGPDNMFFKTAAQFTIPEKYKFNFDLLLRNARLPLKLLLFDAVLSFIKEIISEGKQIFLFVNGNAEQQLNKIKQIEWQGLEKYFTVYFAEELEPKPSVAGLKFIIEKHNLKKENLLMIGKNDIDLICAASAQIDFLQVDKLFLP